MDYREILRETKGKDAIRLSVYRCRDDAMRHRADRVANAVCAPYMIAEYHDGKRNPEALPTMARSKADIAGMAYAMSDLVGEVTLRTFVSVRDGVVLSIEIIPFN